nr:TPM domain-containing protein [uncultured Brevundimonas sp.]
MAAPSFLRRMARRLSVLMLGLLILASTTPALAQAAPQFPPLTGRIVDQARLLSPAKEAEIDAKLAALEADTSDQLVVVTLNSLDGFEIEDYGYRLGRHWGIGRGQKDNGVLLIVAPNERKARIEVGYGLEPILTDAFSSRVIQTLMLPAFRTGGYERGITEGVDALIAQMRLDPAEAQARAQGVEPERAQAPIGPMILIALVFLFMFMGAMGSASRRGRRYRRRGVSPVLVWAASEAFRASASSRRGGFGSGGIGGGFRGGGGSFGGGGASGGW